MGKTLSLYTYSQQVKVLGVFFKNPEIFLKIIFWEYDCQRHIAVGAGP